MEATQEGTASPETMAGRDFKDLIVGKGLKGPRGSVLKTPQPGQTFWDPSC